MAAPTVTALSPTSGTTAGGTVVSITGTGMGTVSAVAFGTTPASDFAIMSETQVIAVAPAGTSIVHVTVTNGDGTSAETAADYYQFTDGLFTIAEARAFDKGQLADSAKFADSDITAKEAEIRDWFLQVMGVDFFPTTHTDEYHDGDNTSLLLLDWPKPISITAASIRSSGTATWTALTATELTALQPTDSGLVRREGSYWPAGTRNVKLTYSAGHATVPELVKRAALMIAVTELPSTNVPFSADAFDAGGMQVSFAAGDGFRGAWHRIAEVRKVINLYSYKTAGIA